MACGTVCRHLRRQRVRGVGVGAPAFGASRGRGYERRLTRLRRTGGQRGLPAPQREGRVRRAGRDRCFGTGRGVRGLSAHGERGGSTRATGGRDEARRGPLGRLSARGRGPVQRVVRGASRAEASERGALWTAGGLRAAAGEARGEPRLLPDGCRTGARAGREAAKGLVGGNQRFERGERGGGQAYYEDALRLRQRERRALRARRWGAAPPAHAGDRGGLETCGRGAGGHVRAPSPAYHAWGAGDEIPF